MTDINIEQYKVSKEPFYEAQGDEIALYAAAYEARHDSSSPIQGSKKGNCPFFKPR